MTEAVKRRLPDRPGWWLWREAGTMNAEPSSWIPVWVHLPLTGDGLRFGASETGESWAVDHERCEWGPPVPGIEVLQALEGLSYAVAAQERYFAIENGVEWTDAAEALADRLDEAADVLADAMQTEARTELLGPVASSTPAFDFSDAAIIAKVRPGDRIADIAERLTVPVAALYARLTSSPELADRVNQKRRLS